MRIVSNFRDLGLQWFAVVTLSVKFALTDGFLYSTVLRTSVRSNYHHQGFRSFRSSTSLYGRGRSGGSDNKNKKNGKTVKKGDLPTKICVVCERPFTWRKKWERCWDEVQCCSKSCNAQRRSGP